MTTRSAALEQGIESRAGAAADEQVEQAAREAMEFYARIRRPDDELPEPYQAGGEWRAYVEERAWLYDAMVAGDEGAVVEALTRFWRNRLGPIVSQYAYFTDIEAGEEAKIERFEQRLTEDFEHWRRLWKVEPAELAVPEVGDPWGLELEGVLVTPLAMRFYGHARQIGDLMRDVESPVVAEIGGGYGGMAHRAIAMTPQLTYVDIDLPETLAIAAFYLLATRPDLDLHLWEPGDSLEREALLEHDVVLVPHYAYEELGEASVDLLLNAFSLSEMKRSAVDAYIGRLGEICRRYFLQNNVDRLGVVNRGFERIPCSEYPIDADLFKTVYFKFDTFQGPAGDYRESLHERISG